MNTIAVVCMLPFFTVIDADTCLTVTVVESPNVNGTVGKYFMFLAEEFTKMVGYDNWQGQQFVIVQSGSQSWDGRVEVWKEGNTSVGKKDSVSADGDWKVNDTIELKGCSNTDNPCKDVSFGECDPNTTRSKVISMNSQQSVQLCNKQCYETYNCRTYRYNSQKKECTLITNDYWDLCDIMAGPMDEKVTDCLGQISNPICDSHVEEDCEYTGELLYRSRPGAITSPYACLGLCEDWAPDCKYWIHDRPNNLCILKREGTKTCKISGGPKAPSYQDCRDNSFK